MIAKLQTLQNEHKVSRDEKKQVGFHKRLCPKTAFPQFVRDAVYPCLTRSHLALSNARPKTRRLSPARSPMEHLHPTVILLATWSALVVHPSQS